jgi:pimeloyl-ACP methyl ester carboxylesterase
MTLTRWLTAAVWLIPFALKAQTAQDGVPYGNNPAAAHVVTTRGFRMYYETYGQGAPLLIIHGNGGSIDDFTNQIPYFSRHFHVVVADSRAQGKSPDNSDSLSYEMITDDLNALLDTLHLDSCYIIGWSDGGIEGLLMAMRHPDKVRKLAVTGANLWPDTTAVAPFAYHWAMRMNQELKTKGDSAGVRNERKLLHLLSYEPHISLQALHGIRCPTLVIGGDHDVILPQHTLLIAQNIPLSDLWILPNSGHSTPIFYKEDFNRIVDHFFETPYRSITGDGIFQ